MTDPAPRRSRNRLLARLSEERLARLAPHLEPVELVHGTALENPGEPIAHIYFPLSGVVSVVAQGGDGRRIEAGLFGRDGMSGLAVVLGNHRSPHLTQVQIPGNGLRIEADILREAMDDAGIRTVLLNYAQCFAVQTAHTVLANGRQRIEERLARWLLMCHDRIGGEVLELTHEFMSIMLGVRRAGVTVAIHMIEGQGLIKATRGRIRILDRAGLEAAADGTYGVPEAEYERLLGPLRDET